MIILNHMLQLFYFDLLIQEILAEIGDFSRFDSPDKILAYAGLSPSTYQLKLPTPKSS